jgi:hypothetical protein
VRVEVEQDPGEQFVVLRAEHLHAEDPGQVRLQDGDGERIAVPTAARARRDTSGGSVRSSSASSSRPQRLLRAEAVASQARGDPGRLGDPADRRRLEPLLAERVAARPRGSAPGP